MQESGKKNFNFAQKKFQQWLFFITMPLSLALISTLSIDVVRGRSFTDDTLYMYLQLAVCAVFMMEFCLGLATAERKWRYFRRHLLLLLISIPYSNFMEYKWSAESEVWRGSLVMHDVLQLVPLLRASIAVAIVVGYVSKNRLVSIFASYLTILGLTIYFSSVLFYLRESPVNENVTSYWVSLWWCSLESTTIGAPFNAVTPIGRVLACVCSLMGIVMFPLFTVYLGNAVEKWRESV